MAQTRLLNEPHAQLEPYFPLPARFGPSLTWGAALLGVTTTCGAALSVYVGQSAPARYRLALTQLPAHAPARTILGVGFCLLGLLLFLVSWSVFHSLELRLQGISARNSLANRLAYRLGTLVAAGLFASGSAVHAPHHAHFLFALLLATTGALALAQFCTITWLVHTNQHRLMRHAKDFFWLRAKKGALCAMVLIALTRCVRAPGWRTPPCARACGAQC